MSDEKIQDNKLQILGKLTASLVHEIRNPLSAIKLNLDYLQMISNELTQEVNESVKDCTEATLRIQNLVENVLDFSRKKLSVSNFISINKITEQSINIMQGEFVKNKATIKTDLDDSLPDVYFEKYKLMQVFLNLLTNALESCDCNGQICVRTFKKGEGENFFIFWEVEDNGSGISADDKTKIFEDFYTSKKKGTGLGLSVCKMLLNEFQAELDFKSELKKGTKFIIRFNPNLIRRANER